MFTRVFLSCVLAIATVLGPYASAQRAEAIAPAAVVPYAVGTAFATVASLYGYSVASGDTDFEALGNSVMEGIDNVSVDDFNKSLAIFGTFNPVTSVSAAQSYVKEWLSSAGQSGAIALDDLTALGDITTSYLPVILSQLLGIGSGSSSGSFPSTVEFGGYTFNVKDSSIVPVAIVSNIDKYYPGATFLGYCQYSGKNCYLYSKAGTTFSVGPTKNNASALTFSDISGCLVARHYDNKGEYEFTSSASITFSAINSSYFSVSPYLAGMLDSSFGGSDNPDVINGRFDDAAALGNPDVLNPGRSQALGSDAVFDGDTLVSHGNIGVLNPSDYADIDSWADALAKLRAGILEDINAAVAAGVITLESAITAALDGALVTDKVSNLNGKDTGSSISRPRNWKNLGSKFTQIFPFCLYFDLVEMIVLLDAEPVAPKFDWVVPSIWGDDFKVTFDLSPWDSAASFLRMLLTFAFAVGFVFLLLRFVNPGRDNSDDGGSKG